VKRLSTFEIVFTPLKNWQRFKLNIEKFSLSEAYMPEDTLVEKGILERTFIDAFK